LLACTSDGLGHIGGETDNPTQMSRLIIKAAQRSVGKPRPCGFETGAIWLNKATPPKKFTGDLKQDWEKTGLDVVRTLDNCLGTVGNICCFHRLWQYQPLKTLENEPASKFVPYRSVYSPSASAAD
jgi:hypothetical protein